VFGRRVKILRLSGFDVYVDASWLVLAALVTWSLADSVFPTMLPGAPRATYWVMGASGAVGLFLSIVLHEFAHSVLARANGIRMRGITLFIFGGVAEMMDEPPTPESEFKMAIAGPIMSAIVGGACFVLAVSLGALTQEVSTTLRYLAQINLLLAGFNMVPAFPLDGGRVLRSILWKVWNSLKRATHISSIIGSAFGLVMILTGVVMILVGHFVTGFWWFLLGTFVRSAAQQSYEQVLLRQYLQGEPVARFMNRNVVTVPADLSLDEFVQNYVYYHHFKAYPVVSEGRLLGIVSVEALRGIPREEWPSLTVAQVMEACDGTNAIPPTLDTLQALSLMARQGKSRLLVVENDQLLGMISFRDIMEFFNLKVALDESIP
jgi:Zn-dependent protease/CBS domain-containing protein